MRFGISRRKILTLGAAAALSCNGNLPIFGRAEAQNAEQRAPEQGQNEAQLPRDGADSRPNIIFILGDNCRWDTLGCMGHPFIQTPAIDRLASEGVIFENAFNTTPLCSPSRASILTGLYAHSHGVMNNHTAWTGEKTTFLEPLSQAGYDTAFVGKWHMPGEGLPEMPFLDLFVSYTYREGQGAYFNCPLIVNGRETPSRRPYITEEVTDRTIEFIEGRVQQNRPFCVYLSHRTAHPPFQSPEGISGMYRNQEVQLPNTVDSWFSRTEGNVFQGIMMGSYENQYRRYCEVITAMDRDIGRLIDRVDELGIRDNTVVVYMADNGMLWGEHRCHGIREPYEESIRLPFIVRSPFHVPTPGTRRQQMVLNIDIAPTFLDIAGVPIPEDMEGQSFLPQLRDPSSAGRDAWLIEFWKYFPENTPSYVGVRTEQYKYVEYEKTRSPQIFDLNQDPREQNNIFGTPSGQTALPELLSALEGLNPRQRYRAT